MNQIDYQIDDFMLYCQGEGLRLKLIMDSGMRIGEFLALKVAGIDNKRGAILIPQDATKGRKNRFVFYSVTMSNLLRRWLQYKDRYVEIELLFCTKHVTNVTISNFETNFKKDCDNINLKNINLKNISIRCIINNYAKRFLLAGKDIYTLSRLLGHSSVTVTKKAYLDLTDEDLRKSYVKFSPLINIHKNKWYPDGVS